jgi:hypothetical protein
MMNDPKPNLSPAAILANALYYQALADAAQQSHQEYLRARNHWQSLFKSSAKQVDTQA